MDKDKENQEISVLGRLFSIEVFLCLMGIASLISFFFTGELTQLFWGVIIVGGAVALYFVRKKDWKKHWAEQEELRRAYEEKRRKGKEKDGTGKN